MTASLCFSGASPLSQPDGGSPSLSGRVNVTSDLVVLVSNSHHFTFDCKLAQFTSEITLRCKQRCNCKVTKNCQCWTAPWRLYTPHKEDRSGQKDILQGSRYVDWGSFGVFCAGPPRWTLVFCLHDLPLSEISQTITWLNTSPLRSRWVELGFCFGSFISSSADGATCLNSTIGEHPSYSDLQNQLTIPLYLLCLF